MQDMLSEENDGDRLTLQGRYGAIPITKILWLNNLEHLNQRLNDVQGLIFAIAFEE